MRLLIAVLSNDSTIDSTTINDSCTYQAIVMTLNDFKTSFKFTTLPKLVVFYIHPQKIV